MSANEAIIRALAEPFDASELKFKPGAVSGNRALAMAYVDARVIQDRLDEVLGVDGWSDEYECLSDGSVVCRLRCKIGGEWITKVDVGSQSEQPDGGDRMKAAFSDALKRASVKFGIGRYLYRFPAQWVDYDPLARKFSKTPAIPEWARKGSRHAAPEQSKSAPSKAPALPAGAELKRRLEAYDSKLAGNGLCKPGDLLRHVVAVAEKAGHGADIEKWPELAIALASKETKAFEAQRRQAQPPQPNELTNGTHQAAETKANGQAKQGNGPAEPTIEQENWEHICRLLSEARIIKDGKPDWSGIRDKYKVQRPRELTLSQGREICRLIKAKDPSIFPAEEPTATPL